MVTQGVTVWSGLIQAPAVTTRYAGILTPNMPGVPDSGTTVARAIETTLERRTNARIIAWLYRQRCQVVVTGRQEL